MVPVGEDLEVTVAMDSIAHRFHAGSRIRLSVSPCYWPLAWPSPREVTLELVYGTGAALVLPVRALSEEDRKLRMPDAPEEPPPLEVETVRAGSNGGRAITRDLASGRSELMFDWGLGGLQKLPNGMLYEDTSVARYSITDGDPLSARVRVENTSASGRGDWTVDIRATGEMTSTATHFVVTSSLDVYEGNTRIAARTWTHEFPRDFC
jgi:hypothetical protein